MAPWFAPVEKEAKLAEDEEFEPVEGLEKPNPLFDDDWLVEGDEVKPKLPEAFELVEVVVNPNDVAAWDVVGAAVNAEVFCKEVVAAAQGLLFTEEVSAVTKVWLRKEPLDVAARLKFPSAVRLLVDVLVAPEVQPVVVVNTKADVLQAPTSPAYNALPRANSNTDCKVRFITLLR